MVEVEILGQVITHQYGTLNTGDVLRTSEAFAKHLVEDCAAAKYRKTPVERDNEQPAGVAAVVIEPKVPPASEPVAEPAAPPPDAPGARRVRAKS